MKNRFEENEHATVQVLLSFMEERRVVVESDVCLTVTQPVVTEKMETVQFTNSVRHSAHS